MLKQSKLLTREEEIAAYERGDRDALACSQIRFVYHAARKVCKRLDRRDLLEEAVAAGMLHLAEKLKVYDCRGRLSTYVYHGLQRSIFAGLQVAMNTGGVKKWVRMKGGWRPTLLKCGGERELVFDHKMEIVDRDEVESLMKLSPSSDHKKGMVRMHYAGLTMNEVGKHFGVTRQYIGNVERQVVKQIRAGLKRRGICRTNHES